MYLKQSTASQVRSIGPFVDDADFKTAETGLTIANTDIKLMANGGTSANKNSGGGTHLVNGVYAVTFDATDTATVGELQVSVVVAGALPVFTKFFVLEEAVYDALFAASAPGFATVAALATVGSNVDAILVDTGTTLQAELDGIQADTEDIQARLPAALVGGRMDSTVDGTGMEAGAVTAIRDGIILRTTLRGTATTGGTTTSIPTSAMSPATTAADQLKGRIVIFDHDTTTAALRGQATDITASSASATPTLTVTALTTAPASGDTFTIV